MSEIQSRLQRCLAFCGIAIGALAQGPLAAASFAHRQPFLAVEPLELIPAHRHAFARQEQVQPAFAERRRSAASRSMEARIEF